MKPLPQNDSSLNVETVNNNIKEFLKKGKVSEAATHAIVALSSYDDDDEVGICLNLQNTDVSLFSTCTPKRNVNVMCRETVLQGKSNRLIGV